MKWTSIEILVLSYFYPYQFYFFLYILGVVFQFPGDLPEKASTIEIALSFFFAYIALVWLVLRHLQHREAVPHLSIDLQVSHWFTSDGTVRIGVVAILRNTSKVRVIIGRAVNFAVPAGSTSVKDLTRCGLRWGCVELRQRSISKESYFGTSQEIRKRMILTFKEKS